MSDTVTNSCGDTFKKINANNSAHLTLISLSISRDSDRFLTKKARLSLTLECQYTQTLVSLQVFTYKCLQTISTKTHSITMTANYKYHLQS